MRPAFLVVVALAAEAYAACECGYIISTNSSSGEQILFTDSLQTDFIRTDDVTWDSSPGSDWTVQAYNVTPADSRGPYGKSAEIQNVIWNQLPGDSTGGQGMNGGDPGLQLWVRSQSIAGSDGSGDQLVPIAEVVSTREDFLYGSFRASMKTTAVNGTCAAFFFYHNDSQEIDMEVLSRQMQGGNWSINLVNQSPGSVMNGFNAVGTPGFNVLGLAFNPTSVYAEYRFDWLPDRINFYTDSVLTWTMTDNVPSNPGAIHLIHWSNGDPGWSGGPPGENAVLTVSYVNAYFNSSVNSTQQVSGPCERMASSQACAIPNVVGSPSQPNLANSTQTVPASTSSTSAPPPRHSSTSTLSVEPHALSWFITVLAGIFGFLGS